MTHKKFSYRFNKVIRLVPFSVPLSNSITASLINLYKLKKSPMSKGLIDNEGVTIDNMSNNNPTKLPQGA